MLDSPRVAIQACGYYAAVLLAFIVTGSVFDGFFSFLEVFEMLGNDNLRERIYKLNMDYMRLDTERSGAV